MLAYSVSSDQNVWAFSKKALHYIVFMAQVVYIKKIKKNKTPKQLDSVVQEGPGRWSKVPLLPFYIYASSFECQKRWASHVSCLCKQQSQTNCVFLGEAPEHVNQAGKIPQIHMHIHTQTYMHTINDGTARPAVLISTLSAIFS